MALLGALIPAGAHAAGSLNLIPSLPTLIALLVGFVILIFPLNALIFQPLFSVLDERASRIEGARKRAGQLEGEASDVMHRYRDSIRSVRKESEASRQEQLVEARLEQSSITDDARGEAEAEVARARQEIESSLDEARASLEASAQGLAGAAAERILGRSLS